jgi:hypothetical protein
MPKITTVINIQEKRNESNLHKAFAFEVIRSFWNIGQQFPVIISHCPRHQLSGMELLQVYMTEDISYHLGTVSSYDLPVISIEFMDIYLLLAHLH